MPKNSDWCKKAARNSTRQDRGGLGEGGILGVGRSVGVTSLVTLRVGVNDMLVACAGPRGKREIYVYLEIIRNHWETS